MKKIRYFALSALLIIAIVFMPSPIKSKDLAGVYAASTVERSGLNIFDENLHNESENLHDEKVYDTTRLEDEFADDTIGVVLTREASRNFKSYTKADFPELRLSQVRHVAMHAEENVRQQLLEMKNNNFSQIEKQDNYTSQRDSNININTFRQSICITLQEPGKEDVLEAIRLLEKRSDVYGASPNHIVRNALPVLDEVECELYDGECESHGGECGQHKAESELNGTITPQTSSNYQTSSWGLNQISAPAAWAITKGSNTVSVGILDTGIQADHSDLQTNWGNKMKTKVNGCSCNKEC